jgi:hypothetical protein
MELPLFHSSAFFGLILKIFQRKINYQIMEDSGIAE